MHRDQLLQLLRSVQDGAMSPEDAATDLANLPFEDIGFAKIDHHRALRSDMPEVIFAAGKSHQQTVAIFDRIANSGVDVLATKADEETFLAIQSIVQAATYHPLARCVTLRQTARVVLGNVVVVCAGTSDLPIAEEASVTAELFGTNVTRICDVGVAGIHRLLAQRPLLQQADVIVACAGMEGALPSVIGGMVGVPVIAVPTSVGYGASLHGIAALLGMLNACSPNISVVNIDNGFGAGYLATLIARQCQKNV
jgi:pyridinium-3,5-biscarboxylic acid mononucleotide synthase